VLVSSNSILAGCEVPTSYDCSFRFSLALTPRVFTATAAWSADESSATLTIDGTRFHNDTALNTVEVGGGECIVTSFTTLADGSITGYDFAS
jgi:hypothetical protein